MAIIGYCNLAYAAPEKRKWVVNFTEEMQYNKLNFNLYYIKAKDNTEYTGSIVLQDKLGNTLNQMNIRGCTFGGIIPNLKDYLKQRKFLQITPIQKNAVVVSVISNCGAQNYWNNYVVTDKCIANGETRTSSSRMKDNIIPYSINYGFGARREAVPMYFIVSTDNYVKIQPPEFKDVQNRSIFAALAAKHMRDFRYVSENFTPESFNNDERIKYLLDEARATASQSNFNENTYIDDMYEIPLTYTSLQKYISEINSAPDYGAELSCH